MTGVVATYSTGGWGLRHGHLAPILRISGAEATSGAQQQQHSILSFLDMNTDEIAGLQSFDWRALLGTVCSRR
jgi:hypothetical protein